MVSVNAAIGAEVVLCSVSIELVELKQLRALYYIDPIELYGCHNSTLAPTDRAITAPRIDDSVREIQKEFDSAAMARRFVFVLDRRLANLLDHARVLLDS